MALVPSTLAVQPEELGNGGPKDSKLVYQLQIIGMDKSEKSTMDEYHDHGRRIFVQLEKNTRISLVEGEKFQVIDYDGLDGKAGLLMPPPITDFDSCDPTGDEGCTYEYRIYVRALGNPHANNYVEIIPGFIDSGTEWHSVATVTVTQARDGSPKFSDKTIDLTRIKQDFGNGVENHYLFQDDFNYFWDYDNHGLKRLQMRFYVSKV